MGLCGSRGQVEPASKYRAQTTVRVSPTAARHDQQAVDKHGEDEAAKVLLLGSGEAGKSTLFKQLLSLHGAGYDEQTRAAYRPAILTGTIQGMKTLVQQSLALHNAPVPTRYNDALATDAAAVLACPLPSQLPSSATGEPPPPPPFPASLARSIARLWSDAGIRATYALRHRFQCPDQVDYFFDRVESLSSPSYVPSFTDLLHVRARTLGIVQGHIALPAPPPLPSSSPTQAPGRTLPLCLVDVGGQRPERRHWFHALHNVACVVFVASLADFDCTLAEDRRRSNAPTLSASASSFTASAAAPATGAVPATPGCLDDAWMSNRMQDSLGLFTEVCSSHFFHQTDIVLLLNKSDLLSSKMRPGLGGGASLSSAFPEYEGGDSETAALDFIKRQFEAHQIARESRHIHTHVVCATDADSVRDACACVAKCVAAHAQRIAA